MAYIHYYSVPMPPIYDWPNGYLCGTHPWPARQWIEIEENGWKEVYESSTDIVYEAAKTLPGARNYMKAMK